MKRTRNRSERHTHLRALIARITDHPACRDAQFQLCKKRIEWYGKRFQRVNQPPNLLLPERELGNHFRVALAAHSDSERRGKDIQHRVVVEIPPFEYKALERQRPAKVACVVQYNLDLSFLGTLRCDLDIDRTLRWISWLGIGATAEVDSGSTL